MTNCINIEITYNKDWDKNEITCTEVKILDDLSDEAIKVLGVTIYEYDIVNRAYHSQKNALEELAMLRNESQFIFHIEYYGLDSFKVIKVGVVEAEQKENKS